MSFLKCLHLHRLGDLPKKYLFQPMPQHTAWVGWIVFDMTREHTLVSRDLALSAPPPKDAGEWDFGELEGLTSRCRPERIGDIH
jgi:hypothetical protein